MFGRKKVAVIGGGVAGIVSAWRLSSQYEVSIFEAGSYLGGHTNTVCIPSGVDQGMPLDTGFIVLNDWTYPHFTRFLSEIGAEIRYADMSFSVFCPSSKLQYCSRDLNVLFAQRKNLFSPRFLGMLIELKRFWDVGSATLKQKSLGSKTLLEFLNEHRFSKVLREDFLYPLAAAVWSSSDQQLDKFPAITFLTFFRNHGWLSYLHQPRWQTVVGGSFSYVRKFQQLFGGNVYLNSTVAQVKKTLLGQEVLLINGKREIFDLVVIATHADLVLPLLKDPSDDEARVFSSWKYSNNRTILHTDSAFMPPLKRAWGAWNYRKEPRETGIEPVSVTYHMNRLQGLNCAQEYFVTLNPRFEPKAGTLLREFNYTHPVYTPASVNSQADLMQWNGAQGRWYCGSYCGYGFHEDAVRSAEFVVGSILK